MANPPSTPENISIVRPLASLPAERLRHEFQFELNAAPDGRWVQLLENEVSGYHMQTGGEPMQIKVASKILSLICLTANLEQRAEYLKKTIVTVNEQRATIYQREVTAHRNAENARISEAERQRIADAEAQEALNRLKF